MPLPEALAALAAADGTTPREAALGAFRRHLGRIQAHVRETFEQGEITGLQAGHELSELTDGLVERALCACRGDAR